MKPSLREIEEAYSGPQQQGKQGVIKMAATVCVDLQLQLLSFPMAGKGAPSDYGDREGSALTADL